MTVQPRRQRWLIYIEPLVEKGLPLWKSGWLRQGRRLVDAIRSGRGSNDEFVVFCGQALAGEAHQQFPSIKVLTLAHADFVPAFGTDPVEITLGWYRDTTPAKELAELGGLIKKKLGEFRPDVCITFSPAPFLKSAFPTCRVFHFETGMLSRAPACETAYFDPLGMLNEGMLGKYRKEIRAYKASPEELRAAKRIRQLYAKRWARPNDLVRQVRKRASTFRRTVLLALQFSDFYGYTAHAKYRNQYELLVAALAALPSDVGLVVVEHPDHPVLTSAAYADLGGAHPNLIWSLSFRAYASCAQQILPHVDAVMTVSSSVGMQALLWDKPVIVLGSGHLDLIADGHEPSEAADCTLSAQSRRRRQHILAWLLFHFYLPMSFIGRKDWLRDRLLEARKDGSFHALTSAMPPDEVVEAHKAGTTSEFVVDVPRARQAGLQVIACKLIDESDNELRRVVLVSSPSGTSHEFVAALPPVGKATTVELEWVSGEKQVRVDWAQLRSAGSAKPLDLSVSPTVHGNSLSVYDATSGAVAILGEPPVLRLPLSLFELNTDIEAELRVRSVNGSAVDVFRRLLAADLASLVDLPRQTKELAAHAAALERSVAEKDAYAASVLASLQDMQASASLQLSAANEAHEVARSHAAALEIAIRDLERSAREQISGLERERNDALIQIDALLSAGREKDRELRATRLVIEEKQSYIATLERQIREGAAEVAQQLQQLTRERDDAVIQLKAVSLAAREKDRELADLRASLGTKDQYTASLQLRLATEERSAREQLAALGEELQVARLQVESLVEASAVKDRELAEMRSSLNRRDELAVSLQQQLSSSALQIAALEERIVQEEARVVDLEQRLSHNKQEVEMLKRQAVCERQRARSALDEAMESGNRLQAKVGELEHVVNQVSSASAAVREELRITIERLERRESELSELRTRIAGYWLFKLIKVPKALS